MKEIDILTLFPNMIEAFFAESIIARGARRGHLTIRAHQIRDFTLNRQKQVDDYPYGGGFGMVMQAEPLFRCWEHVVVEHGKGHTIYMTPGGAVFRQNDAKRLASGAYEHIILVCGRYEGVDQRFIDECVDEELSIGDYVLTGGEIAACAVADAVCRLIPGVLADEACFEEESHWDGLLEGPQYSRPEVWRGRGVPEVLLSGNHEKIKEWRRREAIMKTERVRPDLIKPD